MSESEPESTDSELRQSLGPLQPWDDGCDMLDQAASLLLTQMKRLLGVQDRLFYINKNKNVL